MWFLKLKKNGLERGRRNGGANKQKANWINNFTNVCNAKYARTPICTFVECNARVYTAFLLRAEKKLHLFSFRPWINCCERCICAHALNHSQRRICVMRQATATTEINKILRVSCLDTSEPRSQRRKTISLLHSHLSRMGNNYSGQISCVMLKLRLRLADAKQEYVMEI